MGGWRVTLIRAGFGLLCISSVASLVCSSPLGPYFVCSANHCLLARGFACIMCAWQELETSSPCTRMDAAPGGRQRQSPFCVFHVPQSRRRGTTDGLGYSQNNESLANRDQGQAWLLFITATHLCNIGWNPDDH